MGSGLSNLLKLEVSNLIEEHQNIPADEELKGLIKSSEEENKDEDEQKETAASWRLEKCPKVIDAVQTFKEHVSSYNPSMGYSMSAEYK